MKKTMYFIKKILKISFLVVMLLFVFCFSINFYIDYYSKDYKFKKNEIDQVPNKKIGLVLGAMVYQNKYPSNMLQDRLDASILLFRNKKFDFFLVSGDNSKNTYDEPSVMKDYLIKKGIDEKLIFLDYAGFDTYDSLYRAKEIFGVKSMIIFSQDFHLSRAVYIARKLGIDAIGFDSEIKYYVFKRNYAREFFAKIKAFFDVDIFYSNPKFLGEKIEIKEK